MKHEQLLKALKLVRSLMKIFNVPIECVMFKFHYVQMKHLLVLVRALFFVRLNSTMFRWNKKAKRKRRKYNKV